MDVGAGHDKDVYSDMVSGLDGPMERGVPVELVLCAGTRPQVKQKTRRVQTANIRSGSINVHLRPQ